MPRITSLLRRGDGDDDLEPPADADIMGMVRVLRRCRDRDRLTARVQRTASPGTITVMSRVSDYQGVGEQLDEGVAELRRQGIDPATVSVACALGRHSDCAGDIEAVQPVHGPDGPRCQCPAVEGHTRGHQATTGGTLQEP